MSYLGMSEDWAERRAEKIEKEEEKKQETNWRSLIKKGQDALTAGSKKALEIVEKKKKRDLSPDSPKHKDEGEGPPYILYAVIGLAAYFGLKGSGWL